MTGYTVHTGTSKKYASGWDAIFGNQKPAAKKPARTKKAPTAAKKTAKKRKK